MKRLPLCACTGGAIPGRSIALAIITDIRSRLAMHCTWLGIFVAAFSNVSSSVILNHEEVLGRKCFYGSSKHFQVPLQQIFFMKSCRRGASRRCSPFFIRKQTASLLNAHYQIARTPNKESTLEETLPDQFSVSLWITVYHPEHEISSTITTLPAVAADASVKPYERVCLTSSCISDQLKI